MRYGYTMVLIGLLVVGVLPTVAAAQEKIYSLEDSIKEALANNWTLRAKMEKYGLLEAGKKSGNKNKISTVAQKG